MDLEQHVSEHLRAGRVREAAAEALRELGPQIRRYLRLLLRDEDDSAEVFSRFGELLWKGLPAFRGEASLRTWAYRLAWSAAHKHRQQAWRRRGRRLSTREASALGGEARTHTAVRVERQRLAADRLREALSDEDRSLLALRIDQELSWAEVAAVLTRDGRPLEAAQAMRRYERLKDRMAKLAREQGLLG